MQQEQLSIWSAGRIGTFFPSRPIEMQRGNSFVYFGILRVFRTYVRGPPLLPSLSAPLLFKALSLSLLSDRYETSGSPQQQKQKHEEEEEGEKQTSRLSAPKHTPPTPPLTKKVGEIRAVGGKNDPQTPPLHAAYKSPLATSSCASPPSISDKEGEV